MSMAVTHPPADADEYATKRDLEQGLRKLRTELMDFMREHFASKTDLEEYATKKDLQSLRTELMEFIREHCVSKADLQHMGRVYAWGVVGAMGVMLAATLAGMWGVVHTLVSLAD